MPFQAIKYSLQKGLCAFFLPHFLFFVVLYSVFYCAPLVFRNSPSISKKANQYMGNLFKASVQLLELDIDTKEIEDYNFVDLLKGNATKELENFLKILDQKLEEKNSNFDEKLQKEKKEQEEFEEKEEFGDLREAIKNADVSKELNYKEFFSKAIGKKFSNDHSEPEEGLFSKTIKTQKEEFDDELNEEDVTLKFFQELIDSEIWNFVILLIIIFFFYLFILISCYKNKITLVKNTELIQSGTKLRTFHNFFYFPIKIYIYDLLMVFLINKCFSILEIALESIESSPEGITIIQQNVLQELERMICTFSTIFLIQGKFKDIFSFVKNNFWSIFSLQISIFILGKIPIVGFACSEMLPHVSAALFYHKTQSKNKN